MYGDASGLANCHQTFDDRLRITVTKRQDIAVKIRRDAAHVVVHSRQYRYRRFGDINTGKYTGRFGDAWQSLFNDFRAKVLQMQEYMVLLRTHTAPLVNLYRHGAANHITRRKVFGIRCIALHEAFTVRIGQIAALTTHPLGDQHAGTIDAGWMELHELHVLDRETRTQHHGAAITGTGMCRCAGKITAAIATGGEDNSM